MSGEIVNKFWHLNGYHYVFYRFLVEKYCEQEYREKKSCLMLDAGCGPKLCSLSHIPENVFVVGVDIVRHNVADSHLKAEKRGFKNFNHVLASITSLPFRDNAFDLAVSVDVLEHVVDKQSALREISRVLTSGGAISGSTSNFLNPVFMFDSVAPKRIADVLVRKFAGKHYERHSRFSYRGLMQGLRDNFKICEVGLLGFPPFQPWLYEFSGKKIPAYFHFWIFFDRLTGKKPLNLLKEMMVFNAKRKRAR